MKADLQVRAIVNYIRNPPAASAESLWFMSADEENTTMQTRPGREVLIRDARPLSVSLDCEGFQLAQHRSGIVDFDGIELDQSLNAKYMAELTELLAEVTGAAHVLMLGGAKQ